MYGHPAAHYESASTRKFQNGRTETIRTCLPEIVNFAVDLLNSEKKSPLQYQALQLAMKAHKDYVLSVKSHLITYFATDSIQRSIRAIVIDSSISLFIVQAINGEGVDRHLLGLKMLAIENGMDVPSIYLDPSYSVSNNWRLSTSQVSAHQHQSFLF